MSRLKNYKFITENFFFFMSENDLIYHDYFTISLFYIIHIPKTNYFPVHQRIFTSAIIRLRTLSHTPNHRTSLRNRSKNVFSISINNFLPKLIEIFDNSYSICENNFGRRWSYFSENIACFESFH